ncbi:MAG: hypothetical protein ACTSU9_12715 [Promethearchaeota archaeon]
MTTSSRFIISWSNNFELVTNHLPDCDGEEGSRIIKLICECNDAFLDGKEIPDDPYWSFYKENIGRLEAIAKMQDLVKNGKVKDLKYSAQESLRTLTSGYYLHSDGQISLVQNFPRLSVI